MMGKDESGTLFALKRHREMIFDPEIEGFGGRLVKLMGDGALVEFPSVVDAVTCAIAIQQAICLKGRPDGIVLRIGINLGDVIIDGDDIYGDGVNIAARLEPLADSGGVCISDIVYESVNGRIGISFLDGGKVSVKNVTKPIQIWRWHPELISPQTTSELPIAINEKVKSDKPSIAVLPFDNMSGDPEQQYFSDGITEDIITDLSKLAGLLVIARNSSFVYRGKSTDIRTVGRELGVRAVLEGSIRRSGNRVRITAQLINAADGTHLWADRYDRDINDIFAVQDDVVQHIVGALKIVLTPREAETLSEVPTQSIEAHDCFLRGRELLYGKQKGKQIFEEVVALMRRSIDLDPTYAEPYAGLAMAYNFDAQNHWSGAADSLELSRLFAEQAVLKGPKVAYAHHAVAVMAFWNGDLDRSKRACEAALVFNPNYPFAYAMRGLGEIYYGRPMSALPDIEKAIRLDPALTHLYTHFLGSAYLVAGKYEAAVVTFRERIRLMPDTDLSRGLMISALGHLGQIEAAKEVAEELKRISPNYSFAEHIARLPFRDIADSDRIKLGFNLTGVQE
jgi:adenylate cyclase